MPYEIWDIPRMINAGLALFSAVVLLSRVRVWMHSSPVLRSYWLGLLALLLSAAEGSIEQAFQHTRPGARVVILTVALVWTAYASYRSIRPRRPKTRRRN